MKDSRCGTWFVVAAISVGLLAFSAPAKAGGLTLEERVERLERRAEMPPPDTHPPYDDSSLRARLDNLEAHLKNLPFGIKLGGMVVTSYQYDFNSPASRNVSVRSFDTDHNSFNLDLFQLEVSREPNDWGVGFVTKVNFGRLAERMASDWNGTGVIGDNSEEQNSVELQDAYITYNPPGLPEFGIQAGKFVTLIGAEVIESPLNYNISRSLAFGFAIPFTHTGLLASIQPVDEFGFTVGVVNGWDNVKDSNDGKSVIGQIAITPSEQFWMLINGIYGAEQPDSGKSKRGLVDVVVNIMPVENFNINLNYDYGNESHRDALTSGTVEWQAVSGILAYDIPELVVPMGFAVRGEFFDDSDGSRLPVPGLTAISTDPNAQVGRHQDVWEVTATVKFVLAEGLMFRAEYRYDKAENELFEQDFRRPTFQDDQHTVAGELSYVF